MVARTTQHGSSRALTSMSSTRMVSLLISMGVVAASLVATGTAQADDAAPSKAKEAQPAAAAPVAAKAKDPAAKDPAKVDGKADSKAKEATRELADGEEKADEADADADAKAKAETKGPEEGVEEPEKKLGARVPWRGTSASWSNDFTPSMIGLGDDYIGGDFQTYSMHFGALVNYFLVDQEPFRLMVNAAVGFSVELTDGGTTTKREPQFDDVPITFTGQVPIYSHDTLPWFTSTNLRARAFLPTSPASQNNGTYLRTQLGATLIQGIPMAYEADHFKAIYLIGAVNYIHRFADSTEAVNDDLNRPRRGSLLQTQGAGQINPILSSTLSGQLNGARIAGDTMSEAVVVFLGEEFADVNFQFFGAFSFNQSYLNQFDDSLVCVETGCQPLDSATTQGDRDVRMGYAFSVGLSIFPWPEWGINLGYANSTDSLAPDGRRANIFYEPTGSTMSFGFSFSPDALYERATGPRRDSPFVIF